MRPRSRKWKRFTSVLLIPRPPFDLKVGLIKRLYDVNPYMFVYIEWLLSRWLPLYAKFKTHLPRKFPKQSYSPHRI